MQDYLDLVRWGICGMTSESHQGYELQELPTGEEHEECKHMESDLEIVP